MWWFYHLANAVLGVLFRLLLDVHVTGVENVPRQGPLIVIMNHLYFFDPVLVAAYVPREIVMMSKVENFFNPFFALIITLYGAFPIRRGEVDRRALRRSVEALKAGRGLLISPEGTRSKITRALQEGKDGTALLALKTGAPILPVALSGQEHFLTNLRRLRRTPARIAIGRPFRLRPPNTKLERHQLHEMTREIMYILSSLLPPRYRGVYADLENATTQYIEFLTVPTESGST